MNDIIKLEILKNIPTVELSEVIKQYEEQKNVDVLSGNIISAIYHGKLDVAKYCYEQNPSIMDNPIMSCILFISNKLSIIKWVHEIGKLTESSMLIPIMMLSQLSELLDLDVIRWLKINCYELFVDNLQRVVICNGISNGSIDYFIELYSILDEGNVTRLSGSPSCCPGCGPSAKHTSEVSCNGGIHQKDYEGMVYLATAKNRIDILSFLWPKRPQGFSIKQFGSASEGHASVDTMQWLYDNCTIEKECYEISLSLCSIGHVAKCLRNFATANNLHGQVNDVGLDVVKWLLENGEDIDLVKVHSMADKHKYYEMMYLIEQRLSYSVWMSIKAKRLFLKMKNIGTIMKPFFAGYDG